MGVELKFSYRQKGLINEYCVIAQKLRTSSPLSTYRPEGPCKLVSVVLINIIPYIVKNINRGIDCVRTKYNGNKSVIKYITLIYQFIKLWSSMRYF